MYCLSADRQVIGIHWYISIIYISMIDRPKPLCLIIISGLNLDDLSANFSYLNSLTQNYPFLVLKSNYNSRKDLFKNYLDMGRGNQENNIPLAQVISDADLSQLHLATINSYAYISYYFNNQNRTKHKKEDWLKLNNNLISDNFSIYNTKKITQQVIKEVGRAYYDFMLINYDDLLDATDNFKYIFEIIDKNIKKLVEIILSYNGGLLITTDSGFNQEKNLVPLFLISKTWKNKSFIDFNYKQDFKNQKLSGEINQLYPTILKILGLSIPDSVKIKSLI